MKQITETKALRSWLAERIELSSYAIAQLKHLEGSGSVLLENHVESLARYRATIFSLDEYDEWLADSGG
jgi:hypothetical protein